MAASASASTSYSTAAHSTNNYCYNVFINHRGPDVKKTFASHLYRRLLSHGLTAFLDQDELQVGLNFDPQIKDAIRTAYVHVAVISPTYAQSEWCLKELVLMLQSKVPIIPVFYKVKPEEVRHTRGDGNYAQALKRLERKINHDSQPRHGSSTIENWRSALSKAVEPSEVWWTQAGNKGLRFHRSHGEQPRYDSIAVEEWRSALSKVAGITGFELKAYNGDEEKLMDDLVERVLGILEGIRSKITEHRAGLDEKVKDFKNKVFLEHHQSAKPQVVGIVGLGGIGKTTLAKELFDQKSSHYKVSTFLSNVRENANKGSLPSLQSQLLKSLTGADVVIDNIDKGKEELKKHLSSYHILVILDDVDHMNQIDALLPTRTDLISDSLLVITSRDKEVIKSSGVENAAIYKLTGLNEQHSRELFCAYAFNQLYPRPSFESLVDNFSKACDGSPLLLKVFGAHVNGKKNQSEWKNLLDRLQQFPPSEIQERFQISYQSLDEDGQQIFLDTACFFNGQKRDTAIRIWDGSGWDGRRGFENLQNKCLVDVDRENNIVMHDHLRDFGRHVAKNSLPRRLWHCTTINDMLEQLSVATVRGIMMVLNEDSDNDDAFGGIDMSTVQLGDTENAVFLERVLTRHSPSLIWLRWSNCPNTSLPPWIPMKCLRVLQVSGSKLNTLWEDESQASFQLRELEINAPLSKIPESIGRLRYLERMVIGRFLSGQVNLTKLPEEFCQLQLLKVLVLTECSKMKFLPDSFGRLRNLQHVDLSFCRNLETLQDSFCDLLRLRHINLSDCHDLERLPDSIGRLSGLQHIDLRGCHNLERLPESFGNLRDLRHINLSVCHDLKRLPNSFGNLNYLQHIDLQGCHKLENLPESFRNLMNLEHINLSNCHGLEKLPDSFGDLSNLQYMDLSGCHNLERLPNYFENLKKLKYLDVEGCSNLIVETIEISDHLEVAHRKQLEQLYFSDENKASIIPLRDFRVAAMASTRQRRMKIKFSCFS